MAHFDRAIPPGGEGKITLTVNLTNFQGPVWKTAVIFSNDPQSPHITVNLRGKVRPNIEFKPSGIVQFWGTKEGQDAKEIDIISVSYPFKILRIENTLGEKISYQMETIIIEKQYRLKVINNRKKESFAGKIKFFTTHPKKPEIQILVRSIGYR